MRTSAFFGLNVATSALFTSRGALLTIAHNTANVETRGFSRQFVEMRASRPLALNNGRGMVGTGSEIFGVGQTRSFFLDRKFWSENAVFGQFSTKSMQLGIVERTFAELAGVGFTNAMDHFFSTLSDLSTNAGNSTYRMNVLQAGTSMTRLINNTAGQLQRQQFDLNSEVRTTVEIINSLGNQITTLNRQIFLSEANGSRANDLRDQRALLVDELSQLVNVTVFEDERNREFAQGQFPNPEDRHRSDQRFTVLINGQAFVEHFDFQSLRVEPRTYAANPTDIVGLYDVFWGRSNIMFDIYSPTLSGQLKALIDLRDGNNGNFGTGPITNWDPVSPRTLTMNPLSRSDFPPTNGMVTFVGPNGARFRVSYETFDAATGEFTFSDNARIPGGFITNQAGWRVEVGATTVYKGIPHYMNKLNQLVRTFARAMNDIFGQGYDVDGNPARFPLFVHDDPTVEFTQPGGTLPADFYDRLNAFNFQINPVLLANPGFFAAAEGATDGVSANELILRLMDVKEDTSLFREGKLEDFIIGISLELAIDARQANNFEINYLDITTTIHNQRKSIMDVDLDEEMTNMLLFQQKFTAASRLINVLNEIYDTLINQVRG